LINKDNHILHDKLFLLFGDTEEQLKAYTEFNSSNNNASYTLSSFSDTPKWMESIGAYPMFLGLDLKGGVHFLLQVDHENITTNMLREIQSDIKKIFGEPFKTGIQNGQPVWAYENHQYSILRDHTSEDLIIIFSSDGIVQSHQFMSNKPSS
jgi:hypothetical protein